MRQRKHFYSIKTHKTIFIVLFAALTYFFVTPQTNLVFAGCGFLGLFSCPVEIHVYTGECQLLGKGFKCIDDKGPRPAPPPPAPAANPGCTVKMGPAGYYQQCEVPTGCAQYTNAKSCNNSKCQWVLPPLKLGQKSDVYVCSERHSGITGGGGGGGGVKTPPNDAVPAPAAPVAPAASVVPPKDDLKCTQKQPVAGVCQAPATAGGDCQLQDTKKGKFESGLCEVNPAQMCCVPVPPQVDLAVKPQDIPPNGPVTKDLNATVKLNDVKDSGDPAVKILNAKLTYASDSATFLDSNFSLGNIPKDDYNIVIQVDKFLDVLLKDKDGDDIFTIGPGTSGESFPPELIAGDVAPRSADPNKPHGDNYIDIHDFNFLLECMSATQSTTCPDKKAADLNFDGVTDEKDLEILKKNFGKKGFATETFGFECKTDPACKSGQNNLQMCSLLCTKKSARS